jgi:hypothetical protein
MPDPLAFHEPVYSPNWQPSQAPVALGDVFASSFDLAQDDTLGIQEARSNARRNAIMQSIRDVTGKRYDLSPMAGGGRKPHDELEMWSDLALIRRTRPDFLKGEPGTRAELEKVVLEETKKRRAADKAIVDRGEGFLSGAAGFGGSLAGAMTDPVNLMTLPVGGGGKTIFQVAAREALINGAIETVLTPVVAHNRAVLGEELTASEALANIGFAAGGAAVLGGGIKAIDLHGGKIPALAGNAYDATVTRIFEMLPEPLQAKWASAMELPDEALPDIAHALIGAERLTPDERAAVHVITRQAEVDAANPFVPGSASAEAHADRLAAAMQAIIDDAPPLRSSTAISTGTVPVRPGPVRRTAPGSLAPDIVDFFKAKGYSEAQSRGIAAGVAAEAASSHTAINPDSGALGLGQWLGPRKAALIRRYGPRPTRAEQLEFLHWELQGGDHGGRAVLAQGDEGAVLDAYIRKFMRPAAGSETSGDLSRGMAALGRDGEAAARAVDAGGDAAPVRDPALDAERVAVDLPEREIFEAPELRRDLFPDETSWRIAQAEADAEMLGTAPRVTRASVWAEARETLEATQAGEVPGALYHPEVGPIDVKWGDAKGGLAKIAEKHPEVLDDLPALLDGMGVKERSDNRVILQSLDHRAVVRLDYDGKAQKWLLSAYQVKGKAPPPADYRGAGGGARDRSPIAGADANIAPDGGAGKAAAAAPAARDDLPVSPSEDPRALDLFDDPHGPGAISTVESLDHDLRRLITEASNEGAEIKPAAAQLVFRFDDGDERGLADVLADLDADEAAIAAIRECL